MVELDTSYVWKHVDKDQILWLKLDLMMKDKMLWLEPDMYESMLIRMKCYGYTRFVWKHVDKNDMLG